ncbi:MAG: hypothetical protein J6K13_08160 [Clostridia bacterium]|nr:hypothetical protein [Clostridia bacterium]
MKEMFEKQIKAHIKHDIECSPGTYGDWERFLKGFKVAEWRLDKVVETSNGHGKMMKFFVTTTFKAKKYENNLVEWEVNVYESDSVGVYFNGTKCSA